MTELSPRQSDVLDFILSSLTTRGVSPTYREIGDALSIASTNGVADHIKALIKKGYLRKDAASTARGAVPTAKARTVRRSRTVPVPVVSGAEVLDPNMTAYLSTVYVDRSFLPANVVVHAFKATARPDLGILDGDLVFVAFRAPRPADLAVFVTNGTPVFGRLDEERKLRVGDVDVEISEEIQVGTVVGMIRPTPSFTRGVPVEDAPSCTAESATL